MCCQKLVFYTKLKTCLNNTTSYSGKLSKASTQLSVYDLCRPLGFIIILFSLFRILRFSYKLCLVATIL